MSRTLDGTQSYSRCPQWIQAEKQTVYLLLLSSTPSVRCSLKQWMYLCSCWTWSTAAHQLLLGRYWKLPSWHFSPCDRIQCNWMLRVQPGSSSEPPETLFCSPGIRANCLVTKTLVVISSAGQGSALLGKCPNHKFSGQSEVSFNVSCSCCSVLPKVCDYSADKR